MQHNIAIATNLYISREKIGVMQPPPLNVLIKTIKIFKYLRILENNNIKEEKNDNINCKNSIISILS